MKSKKENMNKNKPTTETNGSADNLDSLFVDYIDKINIPNEIENSIFNKIDKKQSNFKNVAKSILGIFIFNLPSVSNTTATNLFIASLASMITILTPLTFTNNDNLSQTITTSNFTQIITIDSNIISNTIKDIPIIESKDVAFENDENEITPMIRSSEAIQQQYYAVNNFKINQINHSNIAQSGIQLPLLNILEIPEDFIFELKYSGFDNLRYAETQFTDDAILLNYSFGLWYPINNNLIIGAEFRQERITLSKEDNLQTLNLNCWETGIKYFPDIEIAQIKPFLQVNLGANSKGLISRAGLGLSYDIENQFKIFVGTELNSLIYLNINKFNSTERIGVHCGINLILQ